MAWSAIVAMARNRVIGRDGTIPWHLPDDLAFFKRTTLNHTVVMGRRTYESIGKPLPRRDNIVITRNTDFQAPGCRVVHDLATLQGLDEGFVIGGSHLYQQTLPWIDTLYLTTVAAEFDGDAHFPALVDHEWRERWHEDYPSDHRHTHGFRIACLERLLPAAGIE